MADSKILKESKALSISRVPIELWEIVQSFLPYFSSHALRGALDYETSAEDNHSRIWNYFFKSDDWLNAAYNKGVNPCIISYNLYPLLYNKHSAFNVTKDNNGKRSKCLYLAIVFGRDQDGRAPSSLKTKEMRVLLEKSLQPHSMMRHDIVFTNGSRLNISDIGQEEEFTNVTYPRQLVSRKLDGLHSAYLFWKDESRVCDIKPKDVVGIVKVLTVEGELSVASILVIFL